MHVSLSLSLSIYIYIYIYKTTSPAVRNPSAPLCCNGWPRHLLRMPTKLCV